MLGKTYLNIILNKNIMDIILEFEPNEIESIKNALKSEEGLPALFKKYAPQLFETCFLMLLSTGGKSESFPLLKEMEESEDDQQQVNLNCLLDIVLNICGQIIKINVKGAEEFASILADLGLP